MNAVDLILDLGRWGQQHPTELIAGMVAAPLAAGTASLVLRQGRSASTTHGSARWASRRELRKPTSSDQQGVVLGAGMDACSVMTSERHVLLIWLQHGSGKAWASIIPTLAHLAGQYHRSRSQGWGKLRRHRPLAGPGGAQPHCLLYPVSLAACLYQCGGYHPAQDPQEFGDAYTIGQSLTAPEKMTRKPHLAALSGAGGPDPHRRPTPHWL